MQQIMEMLKAYQGMLTRMDAKLEEAETNKKADREAPKEMTVRMDANQAELKGAIVQIDWKPASVEIKPEAAHEEVPPEDAVVMPVGEPRNRHRDRRNLAAVRRQKKQQERTQKKDGCRKNLVAARRGTTRRAGMARCKGHNQDRRSNRDDGRITPGTKLQWEPEDYERSGRDYGHARKAELDQRT
jgi:plastocyanin